MSDDTYRPSIPPGVDRVEYLRTQVFIERDQVANVSSSDYPGTWHGYDDAWNLDKWKQDFRIIISRLTNTTINFDLIGVHASIANAIRRILIAEVPTMAIEHVYILNNTSCIFDDMLAHRLGLIPIKADPALFECRAKEGPLTDRNTIVFKLYIKCIDNPEARKHAVTRAERYLHSRVLTRDLVWEPQGEQKNVFQSDPIRPVHDDIVIAELAKNQEIEAIMHCVKGIGKDHAKFSPVATATYRLLPEIRLLKSITGEQAYRLQSKFSPGVIAVKEVGGVMIASVAEARNDSISREVLRHKEFENDVVLTRVRDHFIFEVESVGMVQPAVLIVQAMQVLKRKCQLLKQQADNLTIAQEGTSDVPISLSAASTLDQQFLVVARDYTDAEALSRRMAARPAHLQRNARLMAEGHVIASGAMLDDELAATPKMVGSCLMVEFATREELLAAIAEDPYVVGKVWDASRIDVTPFKLASLRKEK